MKKKLILQDISKIKMAKNNKQEKAQTQENLTSTESFIDKYKKPLMIGGGAIVVIVLGIIGYQKFVKEPHEEESKEAYWNAFYEFQNDSLELAANGNENFQGMIEIADEYEGTSGGDIANYTLGVKAMEDGEFQGAIDFFDKCDFEDVVVGTLVIGLKGDCLVELDQLEEAVKLFDKAAGREQNEFTTPMFLKKAGITYEALGNKEKALTAYTKIKDKWQKSEEAKDIDKYIARVEK
jgi:tetratricopeptide (TPR) repeat protein